MSHLELISRLQENIHECLDGEIAGHPFAIVDFPDIRNPGDSAIWIGQRSYLEKKHGRQPAYVSRARDFSAEELEAAVPEGPILIQGGGTFGDIWVGHQNFRERLLERFKGRRIVQLPQSIHFQSKDRLAQAARTIERHGNFLLLVRDKVSRQIAEKNFQCELKMCPDMAFYIGAWPVIRAQQTVLAILRTDKERVQFDRSAYPDVPVEDWIDESATEVTIAKMRGEASVTSERWHQEKRLRGFDAMANHRLQRGMAQIARADAIVTDRLHVHICSLLQGKPNAVLDNSYGKVWGFISSFSGRSPLLYRAKSYVQAVDWAYEHAR